MIRAVLFDIDDTLVDTRYAFRRALAQVIHRWLPDPGPETIRRATDHWIADPQGHFRRYTSGELDFFVQRRLRAQQLHDTFGGPVLDDRSWERWQADYEEAFRASWRLNPGAGQVVEQVRRAGLAVGIVTNGDTTYQRLKLDLVGLSAWFPTLVGVDVLGRGKPDPAVFHLACRSLRVLPEEAAYVGDELEVDARGSRDAGLFGIWLDRHGSGRAPRDVGVLRELADLPVLLGIADG